MKTTKLPIPSCKLQKSSQPKIPKSQLTTCGHLALEVWSLILPILICVCLSSSAVQPSVSLSGLPLFFEPQDGALGEPSMFLARGQNYQFAITTTGVQILLSNAETEQNDSFSHASPITHHSSRVLQMQLLGANAFAPIRGDGILSGKMNYLIGNDPSQWRTDLPVFSKVQIDEVYPGVNLIYYGNQRQLEYDFVIAPHARPEDIALRFDGADKIEINKDGELVLSFGADDIRFHRPVLYQEVGGARRPVEGGYRFEDASTVTFSIGKYNRDLPLVIDPTLAYSGYFGGNFGDTASGVKVDANGFIYIAGQTLSRKWPFPLSESETNNGGRFNGDAFVAKLSNDASNLMFFTFIGGHEDDGALDLTLDSSGNPYITGFTDSTNFPVSATAAFPKIRGFRDPNFNTFPTDAFVTKLNQADGSLMYSTYLGGSRADVAGAIAVDGDGNAYVTGYTFSTDFPNTVSSVDKTNFVNGLTNILAGSNDVFVAKIGPQGDQLLYSAVFGGSGIDEGEGIAVDDSGHVYVCGYTGSTNFFRTPNSLPGTNGLGIREINGMTNAVNFYRGVRNIPFDAFLARFDTTRSGTNSVEYSTLFGGKNNDAAFRMVLYANTDVILTGNSRSVDFPTNNFPAHPRSDANAANADAILVRFSFAPNEVVTNPPGIYYSALFGGLSEDVGWDLALDPSGNVYVVGLTSSGDFPTTNGAPFLHTNHIALHDVFITAFKQDASAMLYSVELGGNNEDFGYGIAVDSAGSAYVVGRTVSGNFPFTNASAIFSSKRNGTNDAFLAKILGDLPSLPPVPPILTSSVSGNGIQLAWPESATGFVLESNTNFASSSSWVSAGLPVTTTNGTQQVQVPMTNGSLFFRLRK